MKIIYIYTTKTDRTFGRYKIGETTRNANERIREQDGTSNSEELEFVFEIKSKLSDKEIHKILESKYGFTKCRKDREWFEKFESDEEVITTINKIISESGIDTRPTYVPRFLQEYIKLSFFEKLRNNKKDKIDFVLELAPRFGKTIWAIDTAQKLFDECGYKICFLPTYMLTALSSFKKTYYEFKGYSNNMVYVTKDDDLQKVISENYGKKMIIVEISLSTKEYEEKLKFVKDIPQYEKVCIMDEADFGTHRFLSQEFIRYIDSKLNVYMSGTGIEKIIHLLENLDDNILRCSYIDMLMVEKGEHPLQQYLVNN